MPEGFRLELEDGYANYPVKSARNFQGQNLVGAGGHISVDTLMVNGLYDFPIAPAFALTLGGGIGAGNVDAHYFDRTGAGFNEIDQGSGTAFAYQLIAGVIWSLSPALDLQVDYRWLSVGRTDHSYSSAFGVPRATKVFDSAEFKQCDGRLSGGSSCHRRLRRHRLRRHLRHHLRHRHLRRHRRRLHRRHRRRRRRRRLHLRRLRCGPSSSFSTSTNRT